MKQKQFYNLMNLLKTDDFEFNLLSHDFKNKSGAKKSKKEKNT